MSSKDLGKEFLSVKEFAELVGITAETLRHYDKKGVFHPAKHGVKHENQYRYYVPTQIITVKVVRVLAEIGVPLQTIKELALDRTPEKLIKLLYKHKNIIADELKFLQEVYSVISTFMELLNEGICATEPEITVVEMPERAIVMGAENDFNGSDNFFREYTRFCSEPHEPKLNLSYPVGGYFESMDAFLNTPSQPTRFFSLDPKGYDERKAGLYSTGYNRGGYGETGDLPKRMEAFARKNGLVFTGPVYNIYLFDELSVTDPEQYLLQVSASVRKTKQLPSRRPARHL